MPRPTVQFLGGRSRSRSRTARKRWVIGLTLVAVVVAIVAGYFWWRTHKPAKSVISSQSPIHSNAPVAVPLPARPLSPPAARPLPAVTNRPLPAPVSVPVATRPISESLAGTRIVLSSNPPATRSPLIAVPTTNAIPVPIAITSTPPNTGSESTNLANVAIENSTRWFLPATNRLAIQIALAAQGISCGSIDGLAGGQTEAALRAYQSQQGLEVTGRPDSATLNRLQPAGLRLTTRQITETDLARLHPVPTTWLGRSRATRLEFETVLELVAEEAQSHPKLIRQLNPSVDFDRIHAGTVLIVPRIEPPALRHAASIRINLGQRWLRAYDDQGTLRLHFPCSIGRIAEKRPVGTLQVLVTVKDPNYTFDPAVFPESAEAQEIHTKLIVPAGPNNPVGVAWIGLNRPGFGIHGTPSPEQVGRTESHGCFRLANWNAELLRRCVGPGTPVVIEP